MEGFGGVIGFVQAERQSRGVKLGKTKLVEADEGRTLRCGVSGVTIYNIVYIAFMVLL